MQKQEHVWQLQDAKAKFSAFMRAAERYPQTVTLHGKAKAVMMSMEMFRMMATQFNRDNPLDKAWPSSGQTSQNIKENA